LLHLYIKAAASGYRALAKRPDLYVFGAVRGFSDMEANWQGVFPAATTQFKANEAIDVDATMRHLDAMIDAGVHGMIMLGTVGENCSLEFNEKIDLLKATVGHINGRVPVLSGVAEYTTRLACRYAEAAAKAGVDGLMVLPGMVYKSDPRETMTHFRAVAKATNLPIMCYNNPVSYGVDITPEMFDELADERKFVAIKESSENCRRITDLRNRCGDRYILFSGVDDLFLESMLLGADGWVSGLVNAFPAENRLSWDLASAGRWDEAVEVYRCSEMLRAPRLPLLDPERSQNMAIIRHAIKTRPKAAQDELAAS
jgi:4-hydroxy-tetrahydrodipicolinate synthase